MNNRIKEARDFAEAAHGDQKRKYVGLPYTVHLEETAQLVWEFTDGNAVHDMYVAAILHDVVEDTDTTFEDVGRHFGGSVMSLVMELTTNEVEKDKEGKKNYLVRKINGMSAPAFLIKLCDRLSNVSGLDAKEIPDKFAGRYIEETQYILDNIRQRSYTVTNKIIDRIQHTLLSIKLERNL
jgi:guanosine-3',5'-bis(diphosphate) 3'-pyrophosphohydrolase